MLFDEIMKIIDEIIIIRDLLLEWGAHVDQTNAVGDTFQSIVRWGILTFFRLFSGHSEYSLSLYSTGLNYVIIYFKPVESINSMYT